MSLMTETSHYGVEPVESLRGGGGGTIVLVCRGRNRGACLGEINRKLLNSMCRDGGSVIVLFLTVWLRVRMRAGGLPVRGRKISFEILAFMLVPF